MTWRSWFEGRLYVRCSRDEIYARSLHTGTEYRDRPLIGLIEEDGRRMVCAVGAEALTRETEARSRGISTVVNVINPLEHSRLFLGDVECAEALLRYVCWNVRPGPLLRPSLVLHPKHEYAGGLADAERGALIQIGQAAGARSVTIYEGPDLDDAELAALPLNTGK